MALNVLRSTSPNGPITQVNTRMIATQCLGCVTGANYTFTDPDGSPSGSYINSRVSTSRGGSQFFGP